MNSAKISARAPAGSEERSHHIKAKLGYEGSTTPMLGQGRQHGPEPGCRPPSRNMRKEDLDFLDKT